MMNRGGNSSDNKVRFDGIMTPYSGIIQKYITQGKHQRRTNRNQDPPLHNMMEHAHTNNTTQQQQQQQPLFGTSSIVDAELLHYHQEQFHQHGYYGDDIDTNTISSDDGTISTMTTYLSGKAANTHLSKTLRLLLIAILTVGSKHLYKTRDGKGHLLNAKRVIIAKARSYAITAADTSENGSGGENTRPQFVYQHPYVTSSYYTSTSNMHVLEKTQELQIDPKRGRASDKDRGIVSRLAILRPFCEFDAEALPMTFACWNSLVPCRAAEMDLGDEEYDTEGGGDYEVNEWVIFDSSVNGTGRKLSKEEEDDWECEVDFTTDGSVGGYHGNGSGKSSPTSSPSTSWIRGIANSVSNTVTNTLNQQKRCRRKNKSKHNQNGEDDKYFDQVGADGQRTTSADLFLFYSQSYSENDVAMKAVDTIMKEFYSPGGWSRCFDNVYAVEANIPEELDLYIPAAQEELYSWVNGPNRQYEAGFRIIQSGEWGDYDGFYLMEGDSVPVKNYWLDVIMGEIDTYRPFAVLGAQYDGDKWDAFYENIPISLLHHTNGNGIYNTSHPLLERLTGQLEVEAPCPYNSIPYDYRMSQMWVEGTLGIVPQLAPKIMMNEEGENITLSNNVAMFSKWANRWNDENPYKYTKAIHNYAATNLIPRHLGPEYVIHGAKLYSPWDPARTDVTLVISEWFFDRSLNLIKNLDNKDHPFSQVIIMLPPSITNTNDYSQYTDVPVTLQYRHTPDFMDLCSAEVKTEHFMITNSYHQVSRHVDLMFTPGKFVPVVPFTPATYPFCLKYPYCKEIIMLSQRWAPKHKQVVLDMDMLYHTEERNSFCSEWIERNGENGDDLYAKWQPMRWKLRNEKIIGPKGPTGTDYLAYLSRENLDSKLYKLTDRSLYGARAPFVKVYRKEEKLDGMSEDELARRLGMTLMSNQTDCSCDRFETEEECAGSGLGCQWRPLFESCHPPEMIDDGIPICSTTEPPTMSPTISIDRQLRETGAPTHSGSPSTESERTTESSEESSDSKPDPSWIASMFKTHEHEAEKVVVSDEEVGRRKLATIQPASTSKEKFHPTRDSLDSLELSDEDRGIHDSRKLNRRLDSLDDVAASGEEDNAIIGRRTLQPGHEKEAKASVGRRTLKSSQKEAKMPPRRRMLEPLALESELDNFAVHDKTRDASDSRKHPKQHTHREDNVDACLKQFGCAHRSLTEIFAVCKSKEHVKTFESTSHCLRHHFDCVNNCSYHLPKEHEHHTDMEVLSKRIEHRSL